MYIRSRKHIRPLKRANTRRKRKHNRYGGMMRRALAPLGKATLSVGEEYAKDYLQKKSHKVLGEIYQDPFHSIKDPNVWITGKKQLRQPDHFHYANDENTNMNNTNNTNNTNNMNVNRRAIWTDTTDITPPSLQISYPLPPSKRPAVASKTNISRIRGGGKNASTFQKRNQTQRRLKN